MANSISGESNRYCTIESSRMVEVRTRDELAAALSLSSAPSIIIPAGIVIHLDGTAVTVTSGNVTITGGGEGAALDAGLLTRVVQVVNSGTLVTIRAVNLIGGIAPAPWSQDGGGGCALVALGGHLKLEDLHVTGCVASFGAGVRAYSLGRVDILRSAITNVAAVSAWGDSGFRGHSQGAAIYVHDGGEARVSDVVIENSQTKSQGTFWAFGGGVFVDTGSLALTRTTLRNVSAVANGDGSVQGGGICILNSNANLTDVTLTDVAGVTYGAGAILAGGIFAAGTSTVVVADVSLEDIRAVGYGASGGIQGSGMCIGDSAVVRLQNMSVSRTEATLTQHVQHAGAQAWGAAIFVWGSAKVDMISIRIAAATTSSSGQGQSAGAGLYITQSSDVSIVDLSIADARSLAVNPGGSAMGAGLFVAGAATVSLTGGRISNASAIVLNPSGGAAMGGSIFVWGTAVVRLSDIEISDSSAVASGPATAQGGGVLVHQFANVTITNMSLRHSLAGSSVSSTGGAAGGALVVSDNARLALADVHVFNASAESEFCCFAQAGGLLANQDSEVSMVRCTFSSVGATTNGMGGASSGGAMVLDNSRTTARGVAITDASATANAAGIVGGGAVMISGSANVVFDNVVIHNATAATFGAGWAGGGAILTETSGGVDLTNVAIYGAKAITHNQGQALGGALFIQGTAAVTITDSTIAEASASSSNTDAWGGALYVVSLDQGTTLVNTTISRATVATSGSIGSNGTADGAGIFVASGALTLSRSTVSDASSSGRGGALFVRSGSVLLTDASQLLGSSAALGGSTFYAEGGETLYQLPAPRGTWIASTQCRVFRQTCERVRNSVECVDPDCCATEAACSLEPNATAVVDGVPCLPPLLIQPCNWLVQPQLIEKLVQVLPRSLEEPYPYACGAGLLGSAEAAGQAGPDCAGPCESGVIAPMAELGGVTDLCLECPEGAWCNTGLANPCAIGTYATGAPDSRVSLDACQSCSTEVAEHATTLADGTASADGCVCEAGFLRAPSVTPPALQCEPCPLHLGCHALNTTLPNAVVGSGHWRPGYATMTAKPCRHPATCSSGTDSKPFYSRFGADTCVDGRGVSGAYCMLCLDPETHFFDAAQERCRPCAQTAGSTVALVVIAAIVIVGVLALQRYVATRVDTLSRTMSLHLSRVSFRARFRILVSFAQVVTQIESVYDLRWPASFQALVQVLHIFNLKMPDWMPTVRWHCVGARSLTSQLLLVAFVPLGIAIAAPLLATLCGREPIALLPFVLGWLYLLLPAISSFGFRALAPCECFAHATGGGAACFLREDYEVECTGELFGRPSACVLGSRSLLNRLLPSCCLLSALMI